MNILKNKSKNRMSVQGNIVVPIIAGKRAIILREERPTISTSPIIAILEVSKEKIVIETENTVYSVVPAYSDEQDEEVRIVG
jgi:hypothetical protein